jgi:DNA invertase Pin-like site-specific DNA recombinase
MATVHSYARFSTPEQAEGDSERRQIEAAKDWCKKHKHKMSGLKLFDKGVSGYRGDKQKALAEFMKKIGKEVQPGDILLIEAMDRLGRKGIKATQNVVNKIHGHGIHIAILTPLEKVYRADSDELGDAIELVAFGYQAHMYSVQLSDRIKGKWVGMRKLARQGEKSIHNKIPAWLEKTEDGFDVTDEGRAVIEYIFERTIQGIGTPTLCAELNRDFQPIATGKNGKRRKTWNHSYIRDTIRGRAVRGEYQPHVIDEKGKRVPEGEVIEDYYPEVVTEDTWLSAQSAIDHNSTVRGPSVGFVHLFNGIVWYAPDRCKANLYTVTQTRTDGRKVTYRRLKSYKAIQRVKGASTATVSVVDFENAVLSYLKEVELPSEDNSKQRKLLKVRQGELVKYRALVRTIDKLIDDPHSGVDLETFGPNKAKAMEKIAELQIQIREIAASLSGSTSDSLAVVQNLIGIEDVETRQQLREAIKQVIQQINILPVKLGKVRRDPIVCLIEILFKGGYARNIVLCGGKHITRPDAKYFKGSTETLDFPDLDIRAEVKRFKKWAAKHYDPQSKGLKAGTVLTMSNEF